MKYFISSLLLLALITPLACNNITPVSTGSGGGRVNPPTATATNLNGWTSTPTATLEPTPAYISTVASGISAPNGLAYANSLIYVADGDGKSVSQVQVLNAGTNAINWTWTGSGSTLFQFPNGVAVNAAGTTVYVLDINNTTGNGTIYALAPAATPTPITSWTSYNGTTMGEPGGLALDSTGNVYVADTDNGLLEEFGSAGATIASWSQNGAYGPVLPIGVAVNSAGTTVFVADGNNEALWVLSSSGSGFTVSNQWYLPYENTGYYLADYGLTVDSSNNVYVADYYKDQVEVYTDTGSLIGLFDGNQSGATPLNGPDALLLYNSNIYVGNNDNNTIEIFGPNNY
jgi:sugar lactone lactonase YvrE